MEQDSIKDAGKPYRRILQSTFIMGGSSIITILLAIVRTKILALILGPSGLGLAGSYTSMIKLMNCVCETGVGESGVRQIAAVSGSGGQAVISRTALMVRRMAFLYGLVGLSLLLYLSTRFSLLTFGNVGHRYDIALLSVTLLFGGISGGRLALIQGLRRIGDLAKVSAYGALIGTVFGIPVIYFYGERGVVFYLIIVSAAAILTAWWYSRGIKLPVATMSWRDSFVESRSLLQLGLAFMVGSLISSGTQYLLQVLVIRSLGLGAAGVYQAAATLSSVYVGIILNAMLTDFYPRLSASCQNDDECRGLVNRQVEVGMLFALPGILATITFAPWVINLFYSSQFMLAVVILKWQILGAFLQVVTWPMGFMFRAKGNGRLVVWTSLFSNGLHLALTWAGIRYFGLSGIGMAFFAMYVSYWAVTYWIIRSKYNFAFSAENISILAVSALATAFVFVASYLSSGSHLLIDVGVTVLAAAFSLKKLLDMSSIRTTEDLWAEIKSHFSTE